MADQQAVPAGTADTPSLPGRGAPTADARDLGEATGGTPRWVKIFGTVGVVLVLLIIVMLLTGHGPGRHMHGGLGPHTPSGGLALAGVTAFGGHPA